MRTITLTQEQSKKLAKDIIDNIKSKAWSYDHGGGYEESTYEHEFDDFSIYVLFSIWPTFSHSWGTYDTPDDTDLDSVDIDELYIVEGVDCDGDEVEITNFDAVRSQVMRWYHN